MHKIVSFYRIGLNEEIISLQKKVFDRFNIPLIQYGFTGTHAEGIEAYLKNEEWESISIIDVDLIPLSKDVFTNAKKIITERPLIYGNAQASNSSAYIAPSFLNFTKFTYKKVGCTDFSGGTYESKEIDVGERFSLTAKQKNIELKYSLPEKCIEPLWFCRTGLYHFDFGIGTYYDNNTFHCFEIRKQERYQIFKDECYKLLDSKHLNPA